MRDGLNIIAVICPLFSILLGACSDSRGPFQTPGHARGMFSIHWSPVIKDAGLPANTDLTLSLQNGGQEIWSRTVPFLKADIRTDISLPSPSAILTAEVKGRAKASFLVPTYGKCEVTLLVGNIARGAAADSVPPFTVVFELSEDGRPTADRVENRSTSLTGTIPVQVSLYRHNTGAAGGEPSDDVPVTIFMDGSVVFRGNARAGQLEGPNFLFRVPRGRHRLRLVIADLGPREIEFDADDQVWVAADFRSIAPEFLHFKVSNQPVPVY